MELSAYSEGESYQQPSHRSHFGRPVAAGLFFLLVGIGTCAVAITPRGGAAPQFRQEAVQQDFIVWDWICGWFGKCSAAASPTSAPALPGNASALPGNASALPSNASALPPPSTAAPLVDECGNISTFQRAQALAKLALEAANATLIAAKANIQTRMVHGQRYLQKAKDVLASATEATMKQAQKAVHDAEVNVETYQDQAHEKHAKAITAYSKAYEGAEKILAMKEGEWLKFARDSADPLLKAGEAAKSAAEDALGEGKR